METTLRDFKDKKDDRYTRAALIAKLCEVFELWPDKPIAMHIADIFRSKGELNGNPKNPFTAVIKPRNWSNEKALKRVEEYVKEMQKSYLGNGEYDDEFEYERKMGR